MKLKKYVFGCEVKLFFIKEKYSNLFLYIKVVFLKIVWVHGLMNGCVCVCEGGRGSMNKKIGVLITRCAIQLKVVFKLMN